MSKKLTKMLLNKDIKKRKLHNISNDDVAKIFYDIAEILEIQNIKFKPRAYQNAAQEIETLPQPLSKYYYEGTIDDIPNIGSSLTAKIKELLETGKLTYYEKLKRQLPKGIYKLMNIPGMGPKRIKLLYDKLKIRTISDLKNAVKHHLIRKIRGFAEKSEQDILKSLSLKNVKLKRPYKTVLAEANRLKKILEKLSQTKRIIIAGSIRRKKRMIRDIDILIESNQPMPIMEKFTKNPLVLNVLAKGKTKSEIITKKGIQADLRVIPKESWGAALHYFTGPKLHNIKLRKIAIKKGYKMSEYGIYDRKTGKQIAGKTEKEIYKTLGLKYIEPEKRENYV